MAIKSDKWIRRMALEHDMINPFTEKQMRKGGFLRLIELRIRPARRRRVQDLHQRKLRRRRPEEI